MVDGCLSKLVNVVSGVSQCIGSVIVPPVYFRVFTSWKICWSAMLMTPLWWLLCHPQVLRVTVAESLICDVGRVSVWCDLWGMKSNASKTKTIIVSRACKMPPQSSTLTIGGTVCWSFISATVLMTFYIGSDIWFQDDLWEVSSLSFQSSFSKTWHLEEILVSIPSYLLIHDACCSVVYRLLLPYLPIPDACCLVV